MQTIFPHTKPRPNIIVFGDLILDHGIHGTVNKLANEGPIPVLHQSYETWSLGGAANVAANLVAMGANVYLGAAIGKDSAGEKALQLLKQNHINWVGIEDDNFPTIVKTRGFMGSKLLFRYDQEECNISIPVVFKYNSIISNLFKNNTFNAVVFSDYNKGFCNKSTIDVVFYNCTQCAIQIPIIVDPKGDFRKYKDCTLIKPNFDEATRYYDEYAPSSSPLSPKASTKQDFLKKYHKWLHTSTNCKYSCITCSKDGISLSHVQGNILSASTQPIDVIDVTGAGDIVTAVAAYCLAVSISPQSMIKVATYLATQSVQHRGTYVLKSTDFWSARTRIHESKRIFFEDIPKIPRDKSIVFTNGCFDLLHPGHVQSLEFAKSQGEVLIVGINSDESVRALKGPTRPIQTLETRIKMLESLQCIDYVISFNEISPSKVVEALRPSVLVKGADYANKKIHSAEFAEKIVLCPLKPGMSTSNLISSIQQIANKETKE